MFFDNLAKVTLHEYFYKRLCDYEYQEEELIRSLRTKKGIIPLCEGLREIHLKKLETMAIYDELRLFL